MQSSDAISLLRGAVCPRVHWRSRFTQEYPYLKQLFDLIGKHIRVGYFLHLRLAAGPHTPLAPLPRSASRMKVKTWSNRPAAAPWLPDALSRRSPASLLCMQSPPPAAAMLSLNHLARCLGVRGRVGNYTRVRAACTRTHRRALTLLKHKTHRRTWRGGRAWQDEEMARLDPLDRCRGGN